MRPRCGDTTTPGSAKRGESVHGSLANTSSPAPATMPSRMASASASSSTMPPRAVLMMRIPGLALARRSRPNSPMVSGVFGSMDGDEVGLGHQLLDGHQPHPHRAGPARARRRGRSRSAPCRRRGRAGPPASRPGPARPRRAPCRGARRPPTSTAPIARPPAPRGPGGCCGPGPAAAPWPARPPRGCWRCGALTTMTPTPRWPRRRRRCRVRRRPGRPPERGPGRPAPRR